MTDPDRDSPAAAPAAPREKPIADRETAVVVRSIADAPNAAPAEPREKPIADREKPAALR